MSTAVPASTLVERVSSHGERVAIVAGATRQTYRAIDDVSSRVATALLSDASDLQEARVAFLAPPGADYVAVLLGIWKAGGLAVPLAPSHPAAELKYVIDDSGASVVVASPDVVETLAPIARSARARLTTPLELHASSIRVLPAVSAQRRAVMLYTSGTTGRPKGVVMTQGNVAAQILALVRAWEWTPDDRGLLALPLHHVHGIINVVGSALWAGATCELLPKFDAEVVWARLASGDVTVFSGVPTMYHRLIGSWDQAPDRLKAERVEGCRRVRLMMCGSAALPVHVLERWRQIAGHVLLERYGMTEIGMALSNPLHGERRPGFVGLPLPDVQVRLVDEQGGEVAAGTAGEVEVRGPGVFLEYWRRPEATRGAFRDGWFRTGDLAILEGGAYRLLGRTNVDIIKTGGYKVSALEIEEVLRQHPAISDCAVVGAADPEWGQRVCVALEVSPPSSLSLVDLQDWTKSRLAPYKIPKDLRCVPVLPRNAMGKVVKSLVAALFEEP